MEDIQIKSCQERQMISERRDIVLLSAIEKIIDNANERSSQKHCVIGRIVEGDIFNCYCSETDEYSRRGFKVQDLNKVMEVYKNQNFTFHYSGRKEDIVSISW